MIGIPLFKVDEEAFFVKHKTTHSFLTYCSVVQFESNEFLIASLRYVDFSSEVTTVLRVTDNAPVVLKMSERSRIPSFDRPSPRVPNPPSSTKRLFMSCSVILQPLLLSDIVIKKLPSVYVTSRST